jgi:hypothetical protein
VTSILPNTVGSRGARRLAVWGTFAVILISPLVAMRFTDEVRWDQADFVAAAALLIALGIVFELASLLVHRTLTRVSVIVVSSVIVMLIWADAAVGVF